MNQPGKALQFRRWAQGEPVSKICIYRFQLNVARKSDDLAKSVGTFVIPVSVHDQLSRLLRPLVIRGFSR